MARLGETVPAALDVVVVVFVAVPLAASWAHIPPLEGKLDEKALLLFALLPVGVPPLPLPGPLSPHSLCSLGEPLPIGSGSVLPTLLPRIDWLRVNDLGEEDAVKVRSAPPSVSRLEADGMVGSGCGIVIDAADEPGVGLP